MRNLWVVLAFLFTSVLIIGCESGPAYRVNILTDPPGATVALASNTDPMGKRAYPTPLTKTLRFSERTKQHRIQARPAGSFAETHMVTEIVLTQADIDSTPKGTTYPLTIHLDPRPWIDMRSHELIFDPILGWRGFETKDRAYSHILESNNTRPDKIAVLHTPDDEEYDGFRGVNLSPAGLSFVFATFKLDEPEIMPTKKEIHRLEQAGEDISIYVPRRKWLYPIAHSYLRTQFVTGSANDYPVRNGVQIASAS